MSRYSTDFSISLTGLGSFNLLNSCLYALISHITSVLITLLIEVEAVLYHSAKEGGICRPQWFQKVLMCLET